MLDAFVIEELKRRERARDAERPRLFIDMPPPPPPGGAVDDSDPDDQPDRGVLHIPLNP